MKHDRGFTMLVNGYFEIKDNRFVINEHFLQLVSEENDYEENLTNLFNVIFLEKEAIFINFLKYSKLEYRLFTDS